MFKIAVARLVVLSCALGCVAAAQATGPTLADAPLLATSQVPPNVMLTLSVEWPTGTVAAYNDNKNATAGFECPGRDNGMGICYFAGRTYLGYFDAAKCYGYDTQNGYFVPKAVVAAGGDCSVAAGRWSGNYLNWAAMHALDEFRYAMTGGDRYIDTGTSTVVEKSVHTGQGGYSQFPIKRVQTATYTGAAPNVPGVAPSTVSPNTWSTQYARVTNNGYSLASGSARTGRVVQFANNYNFFNAFPSGVRYVKVQLSGTGTLGLAELQVLQVGSGSWSACAAENGTCVVASTSEVRFGGNGNWSTPIVVASGTPCVAGAFIDAPAVSGRACQARAMVNIAQGKSATQSSTSGGAASLALDGNTSGAAGTVTTTASEATPWLEVDLGGSYAIDAIAVFNRVDCCADQLQNFYVMAASSDLATRSLDSELGDSAIWKYQVGPQPASSIALAPRTTDAATEFLNVRVQVCDGSIGLESNCASYGGMNKPTGVIQDNADKMRFGVTAYLNVDGAATMGGVLRSPMKYMGPATIVPNGPSVANARTEITSQGLLVNDPEGAVSSGSEFKASGVISYLNKFGKLGTKSTLKTTDTASEMFYESLRYMRGATAATPQFYTYPGANTPAARDGFPIYTDWTSRSIDSRPIQYACQKNYFVGIGDTNTWCDSWGPGNNRSSSCGASHSTAAPADAPLPSVVDMDNLLGANEALGALGGRWVDAGRGDTYDIAGYAFWANTHDLLPDDPNQPWTLGKQSAQFFWVDVRETGSFNGTVVPKNQYWLAGKYGGFPSTQISQGATQEYPSPSFDPLNANYFTGERPDTLISSLKSVFKNILERQQSNVGASLSSNNLAVAGAAYLVRYNTADWTGEIIGESAGFDANNVFTTSVVWNSASAIDAQNWDTGRRIVTFNPASRAGVPFRQDGGMSATQLSYLGGSASAQASMVNYLRGDASNESGTSSLYRARTHKLGDIVNAAPLVVTAPSEGYAEDTNPGFAAFAQTWKSRNPVLFVGSNDGMLHAIDARVDSATAPRGSELFAYVPSVVLSGPSSPATPLVDGIASRSAKTFVHKFLVDGQVSARSVDFGRTGGSTGTADWHTVLVGGLGKGGRGIYALDVTNPAAWTSEAGVARNVLWEFTDPDMGYGFGTPQLVKTARWGWVVLVASGYGNASGAGWVAVLNAKTGALIQKISTGVGTTAAPAGLAQFTAFAPDRSDLVVDAAYAGDLLGNVWRFDLTTTSGSYPAPTLLTTAKDANGKVQPITARPSVGVAQDTLVRYVFVATGVMLASSDISNSSVQTLYALRDGLQSHFTATQVDGSALPIVRASLVPVTNAGLQSGVTLDPTKSGWYLDFTGTSAGGATERVVSSIDVNQGLVTFTTETPSTDVCSPGVSSNLYAIYFTTPMSALVNPVDGSVEPFYHSETPVFDPQVVSDPNGSMHIVVTNAAPTLSEPNALTQQAFGGPVKLNWVEILN